MFRKLILLLFCCLSFSCIKALDDVESLNYQHANPPYDIELRKCNADDYLLLFRSENRSNIRFGGFLIFIDPDPDVLRQEADFDNMSSSERSAFIADAACDLSGSAYNTGRDKQVAVLFSDNTDYNAGGTIEINGIGYSITTRVERSLITAGSCMTLRTYLIEICDNIGDCEIISASPPGVSSEGDNVVYISHD